MECSSCGFRNRSGVNFCEECGTKLIKSAKFEYEGKCARCATPLLKGSSFCIECGEPVSHPSAQEQINGAPLAVAEQPTAHVSDISENIQESVDGTLQEDPDEVDPDEPVVSSLKPRVRLRLFKDENQVKLQLLDGSEKEMVVDFSEPLVAERSTIMTQLEKGWFTNPTVLALHKLIGEQLFANILPAGKKDNNEIRKHVLNSVKAAQSKQSPLLLQLEFDADAVSPAQLPWELIHDGTDHLALEEVIHLNRYVTYFGDRGPFEPVEQLNILYVIARPADQTHLPDYYESDELIKSMSNLIHKGRARVDILEVATLAEMQKAVKNGNYHIIHWDGHGGFRDGVGLLCFENEANQTDYVSAQQLADILKDSSVRLVLLSACQSAMVGGTSIFNTFGPALIRNKVPAVIAFQYTVPVIATSAFTKEFYRSLARGEPISAAVADGRKKMTGMTRTWFFPALYMRVADGEGYLFTGEPEEHKRQRMEDLMELARRWASLAPAIQALYQEGAPVWPEEPDELTGIDSSGDSLDGSLPIGIESDFYTDNESPSDLQNDLTLGANADGKPQAEPESDADINCSNDVKKIKKFLTELYELWEGNLHLNYPNPSSEGYYLLAAPGEAEGYDALFKAIPSFLDRWNTAIAVKWNLFPPWSMFTQPGAIRIINPDYQPFFEFRPDTQLKLLEMAEEAIAKAPFEEVRNPFLQVDPFEPPTKEEIEKSLCDHVQFLIKVFGLP